jgi:hypothetical protein
MNAYPDPAAKATLLPQEHLTAIGKLLPSGAIIVGGFYAASGTAGTDSDTLPPDIDVEVIYAADDHTIHTAMVHYVGPGHYEITSDVVSGHW